MAVISSEKTYIKGIGSFQKKVKYVSKGAKFIIDLPEIIAQDMALEKGKWFVEADSEDAVNKKYKELLKEWEETAAKTTKVIVFQVKSSGAIYTDEWLAKHYDGKYTPAYKSSMHDFDGKFRFVERGFGGSTGESAASLAIIWAVYEKREVKSNKSYTFILGRRIDSFSEGAFGNSISEIEWTQEKEDFFMDLDRKFMYMIEAAFNGLKDLTEDKLKDLMDGKQKLLG